jgi:hypothetical protein
LPLRSRAAAWLVIAAAALLWAAPAHARIMQADDQSTCFTKGGDVSAFMRTHHATVLRIIVPFWGNGQAPTCASKAAAQGYRVYLSLQYNNRWSPARVAAYFRRTLPQYAPYAWAVSLGNEQDLVQGGRATGQNYRSVWNAVEPVLASVAPHAIRVYGETSPFGFPFLQQSFQPGRPRGAQAIAFHCYDVNNGGLTVVPQVAKWAADKRLPLWCSEMSASLRHSPHPWLKQDSQARWNALVAAAERHSPNLRMVSYYRWPQIGAL